MKHIYITFVALLVVILAVSLVERKRLLVIYDEGVALVERGDYAAAIDRFKDIPNYENYRDVLKILEEVEGSCPLCGEKYGGADNG